MSLHLRIILWILGISLIFGTGAYVGSKAVYAKWNQDKLEYAQMILETKQANDAKVKEYAHANSQLVQQIVENKKTYTDIIDTVRADYDARLSESEARTQVYQRMCTASSGKSFNLPDHTTKLDKSITEGRRVVKELTELIKLRDKQLEALGQQLDELKSAGVIE